MSYNIPLGPSFPRHHAIVAAATGTPNVIVMKIQSFRPNFGFFWKYIITNIFTAIAATSRFWAVTKIDVIKPYKWHNSFGYTCFLVIITCKWSDPCAKLNNPSQIARYTTKRSHLLHAKKAWSPCLLNDMMIATAAHIKLTETQTTAGMCRA